MKSPLEHHEAVMLMRAVRGAEPTWPELRFFAAIPNGGWRSKRVAAQLKAEGVRKGVPDYLFPIPRGGYTGLAIELKRVKEGRTSPEQREWLDALSAAGWHTAVARGWEQAFAVLKDYLAADGAAANEGGE
jgi:hypothetical protein